MLSKLLQLAIPPWVKIAAIAAPIVLLAGFAGIQTLRLAWLQTAVEKITGKVKIMDAMARQMDAQYRLTENTWRVNTATITKDRDNEIKAISASRDALIAELRKRPRRPAPGTAESAADGQAASGCTGSSLHAEDAEFLIREAARADEIRAGLKACYAQYDVVAGGVK